MDIKIVFIATLADLSYLLFQLKLSSSCSDQLHHADLFCRWPSSTIVHTLTYTSRPCYR